jgi:hypothetical protein
MSKPRQLVRCQLGARLNISSSPAVLDAVSISAWLFGGWGLDARIGRITREHGDVEFWVERTDAGRSKAVLAAAGATALATQPPEESCEFTWDGTEFSTATLTGGQTGRSASLPGDFRTGCSRRAPSVTSQGRLMACRCWP